MRDIETNPIWPRERVGCVSERVGLDRVGSAWPKGGRARGCVRWQRCVCVCVPGLDRRVPGNTVRLDSVCVCVTEAHLDQSVPGARRLHRRCGAAATPHHVDAIHRCGHRGWVAAPQGKVNAERPRSSTSGVRAFRGIGRDEEAQASRIGPGFRGDGEVVRPVVYRGESFQLHVQLVARPGLEGDVHTVRLVSHKTCCGLVARSQSGDTYSKF